MNTAEMTAKIAAGHGFIAALDQSGGSTPKALKGYGIEADAYSNDAEMFDLIHQMRVADHHLARVHRRQGDRCDPVRADDGRAGERRAGAPSAPRPRRRAVHQDRQGAGRRSEWRPADEADAGARRLARSRRQARHVRDQGAVGRSTWPTAQGIAAIVAQQVEIGAASARARPRPDPRARGQHQERRARRVRRDPGRRAQEGARRDDRRREGHAQALAARQSRAICAR